MEFTGVIKGISTDFLTNEVSITLTVNEKEQLLTEYGKLKEHTKLAIKITKFRQKRSLDANAYMWVLLQKMAIVLKTTKDELYVEMLDKYGVFTHIIVKPHVVDRVIGEWRTVRNLGEVKVNGQSGIQLQCFFGSSTYDTEEMANLIDGVVTECKELDIETLPPDEIRMMKERWGV